MTERDIHYFPGLTDSGWNGFSILIPSWNNLEMLQCCIRSIEKNSGLRHQIILHINDGSDGTAQWVRSKGFSHTWSAENVGVCHAINAMARLASQPWLLYLNDDMYVAPGWDTALANLASTFSHDLWYLSGTLAEPVPSSSRQVLGPIDFGQSPHDFDEEAFLRFAEENRKETFWSGASWPPSLVPRSTFERVGGYSPEFSPGMYSDPDFSMKLWQAGVRQFIGLHASLVYHFRSRTTGKVVKNNGRKQFAAKWGVPSSWFYRRVLQMGNPCSLHVKLHFPKGLDFIWAKLRAFYIAAFS